MANSNSHRWGQVIGNLFEESVRQLLISVADEHSLYLDYKHMRPGRVDKNGKKRPGANVTWRDRHGNFHDLDYVMERGGSEDKLGLPVAFIEVAWRRYTKHSKNKVQEIEGALVPLSETYGNLGPFLGCVLSGDFTENALAQLRSRGFQVLHFSSDSIFRAFASEGIAAAYDEDTPDGVPGTFLEQWVLVDEVSRERIGTKIIEANQTKVEGFVSSLTNAIARRVIGVRVVALHGTSYETKTIAGAIAFLSSYAAIRIEGAAIKYEIEVLFTNQDRIQATFHEQTDAVRFLESYQ